jgi:hypothetical protein
MARKVYTAAEFQDALNDQIDKRIRKALRAEHATAPKQKRQRTPRPVRVVQIPRTPGRGIGESYTENITGKEYPNGGNKGGYEQNCDNGISCQEVADEIYESLKHIGAPLLTSEVVWLLPPGSLLYLKYKTFERRQAGLLVILKNDKRFRVSRRNGNCAQVQVISPV